MNPIGPPNKMLKISQNINFLPDEILAAIFKQLDESIEKAAKSCARWRNIIAANTRLMKTFELAVIQKGNNFRLIDDFNSDKYQTLFIATNSQVEVLREIPEAIQEKIFRNSIRKLTLNNVSKNVIENLLRNYENLQNLIISCDQTQADENFANSLRQSLVSNAEDHLQFIRHRNPGQDEILREMCYYDQTSIDLPILLSLEVHLRCVAYLKHLKTINLRSLKVLISSHFFSSEIFNNFLKSCEGLKELSLSGLNSHYNFNIESINCKLETLVIDNIFVSDENLANFIRSQKESLKKFSLNQDRKYPGAIAAALNDLNLEYLELNIETISVNIESDNENIKTLVLFDKVIKNPRRSDRQVTLDITGSNPQQGRSSSIVENLERREHSMLDQRAYLLQHLEATNSQNQRFREIEIRERLHKFAVILDSCSSVENLSIFGVESSQMIRKIFERVAQVLHELKTLRLSKVPELKKKNVKAQNPGIGSKNSNLRNHRAEKQQNFRNIQINFQDQAGPMISFTNLNSLEIDLIENEEQFNFLITFVKHCANLKFLKVNDFSGISIEFFKESLIFLIAKAKSVEEIHFGVEVRDEQIWFGKTSPIIDFLLIMKAKNNLKILRLRNYRWSRNDPENFKKFKTSNFFVKNEYKNYSGELKRNMKKIKSETNKYCEVED